MVFSILNLFIFSLQRMDYNEILTCLNFIVKSFLINFQFPALLTFKVKIIANTELRTIAVSFWVANARKGFNTNWILEHRQEA